MSPHGGARPGAGRKTGSNAYGEPTQPIRVPVSLLPRLQSLLQQASQQAVGTPRVPAASDLPAGAFWPDPQAAALTLPLYASRVPAGFPSPADDYIDQRLDLNDHLIAHPAATFFVRVSGDSMVGAGIHDGDLLIIDRALEAVDGRIVIAAVNGELTVKRLAYRDGSPWLLPENPAYSPLAITEGLDCVIWGVVAHVIHAL